MILDNWKAELEKILPDVEKFLTSVLQEESKIKIVKATSQEAKELKKSLNKKDIFLRMVDDVSKSTAVLVLDPEWYGLLSSIMLGVEEKENNETTRELLKKFGTELTDTLKKDLDRNDIKVSLRDLEVLTARQLDEKLKKGTFFRSEMSISGLADDDVRAELFIQAPGESAEEQPAEEKAEASPAPEEKERDEPAGQEPAEKEETGEGAGDEAGKADDESAGQEPAKEEVRREEIPYEDESQRSPADQLFSDMDEEDYDDRRSEEVEEDEIISGKKVEFDSFETSRGKPANGQSRSMALLKDVEMDVTVQLGQIEMPLGKVLQLAKGSIIELDKLAGEPVDILVNNSRIAQGEVVVIDEHFGVRITNLITTRERLARLK